MRKAMLFLLISAGCFVSCNDHDSDEPEMVAPTIGYMSIDSVLGYNRHVSLDIDRDNKPDLSFISVLTMEGGESGLYLQARANGGTGTRLLIAKNPASKWAYPLPPGATIGEEAIQNAIWGAPAQNATLLRIVRSSAIPQFSGPWLGKTDHYVGFRKLTNGYEQFGWVRISHQPGTQQLTVRDMGMKLISGEITAGERNF